MTYPEYENFLSEALEHLSEANEKADRFFGIGSYARYEYDLHRGEIWWSSEEGPKVRAKAMPVGTLSQTSHTWLWSWANPHFDEIDTSPLERVTEFGRTEDILKLTDAQWEADECDGWGMTAISASLLKMQGGYRCPDQCFLYLIYRDVEFIPENEMAPYLPLKRPAQSD